MRPILAVSVAACILGIVGLYSWFQQTLPSRDDNIELKRIVATGKYTVEVTLTFDAAADDFSLTPRALLLRTDGAEETNALIDERDAIAAGRPLVLEAEGIRVGRNEFYLEAYDADAFSDLWRCVRVRVLKDDTPIAEESLWGQNGVIQESFVIDVAAVERHDEHTHP